MVQMRELPFTLPAISGQSDLIAPKIAKFGATLAVLGINAL